MCEGGPPYHFPQPNARMDAFVNPDQTPLQGISSMATRALLAQLAHSGRGRGLHVHFESVGGVDAARRVAQGEAFDLVVLASDAIDKLIASGSALAEGRTDLVVSKTVVAVPEGAPRIDVGTEQALRKAVLEASAIGHSTGPSGTAVLALLQRWGVLDAVRERLVQAPAGVPVGRLLAEGKASLGFQQTSELVGLAGVSVLGELPAGCEIVTRFTAAVCAASGRRDEARALITYMASPETAAAKLAHGLEPA